MWCQTALRISFPTIQAFLPVTWLGWKIWCRSPGANCCGGIQLEYTYSLNTHVLTFFLLQLRFLLRSSCRNKSILLMCGLFSLLMLPFGNFNSASHVLLPVSNKLRRKRRRMGTGNCSTRPAGPETLRRLLDGMGRVVKLEQRSICNLITSCHFDGLTFTQTQCNTP